MKKEEVYRRLSLGAREWLDKTPSASAIFAILFGKKVSESEILDKLTQSNDDLDLTVSKMENILSGIESTDLMKKFNELKVLLKQELKQKTLTIICGPSSVGKDTIASELKLFIYAYYDSEIDYLKKYTTREPRAGEKGKNKIDPRLVEPSGKYKFYRSKEEFDSNLDIVESYELYGSHYGFSKDDLLNGKDNLICIYGKLEKIDQFRKEIEEKYKRRTFTILLKSERSVLEKRLARRHTIKKSEANIRKEVLFEQCLFIEKNEDFVKLNFDVEVDNSYNASIKYVMDKILNRHFLVTESEKTPYNKSYM